MRKYQLLYFIMAMGILASCTRDQIEPPASPKFVASAIYILDNPQKDTSNPEKVQYYEFDVSGYLKSIRYRPYTSTIAEKTYQVSYNTEKSITSISDFIASPFVYTYEGGRVSAIKYAFGSSSFIYDGSGKLSARVDSSGVTLQSLRVDTLRYSYTDTSIKIRRFINWVNCCNGEAQSNFIYFNKDVENPFKNMSNDGQYLPYRIVYFIEYERFNRNELIRRYQMVNLSGKVDFDRHYEVVALKPGTRLPELIKVTDQNFMSGSELKTIKYHYIVYSQLP